MKEQFFPITRALAVCAALVLIAVLAPAAIAAPTPPVEYGVKLPLLVDGQGGRLYGLVTSNGQDDHIGVFSARNGRPLASYPHKGPFALDAKGNRLFVMSDPDKVTVLDARTGKELGIYPLSSGVEPASPPVAPQYDARAGHLLVFTQNVMTVLDANTGNEMGTARFDVAAQDRCRMPTSASLPITRSFFDPERRLVYLEFVTYSCIPWIGYSIVAYDLEMGSEVSRQTSERYTGLAAKGAFYAMAWHRFGIGTIWTERDGKPSYRSTGWSAGGPFQLDTRRGRLYQSGDGSIRIFNPADMSLSAVVPQPAEGVLSAYDAVSDHVYFVDRASIQPLPASRLGSVAISPARARSTPREPVRLVAPSPAWQQEKTLFAIWSRPWSDPTCYVFNQAASGDLLLSRDGGRQWLQGRAGLPANCGQVSALAISPDYGKDRTLLAGIKGNGIFKSTDGGATWQPAGKGLPSMAVTSLGVPRAFAADRTAFASILDHGLQRSFDGGASWQTLATSNARLVALSPEFDRDGTLAIAGLGRDGASVVQLSEDRGDRWRDVAPPSSADLRLLSLSPSFSRWRVMFAGDFNGDLYRSEDAGQSWQRVLQAGTAEGAGMGAEQMQIAYGPNEEKRELFLVVSGTRSESEKRVAWGRLYRSSDGGQTWGDMSAGTGVTPTALAISPTYAQDRTLLIGTADGRIVQIQPPVLQ